MWGNEKKQKERCGGRRGLWKRPSLWSCAEQTVENAVEAGRPAQAWQVVGDQTRSGERRREGRVQNRFWRGNQMIGRWLWMEGMRGRGLG